MKPVQFFRSSWLSLGVVLSLVVQLVGCGGTQLAGGVGSGGSGLAEGAVTGFGSVIVDGVSYSDGAATVERWGDSGVAEVKWGQRVRVYHTDGQASRIVVLPQLIGRVSAATDAAGDLVMLGQRVHIVSSADAIHPATVFEGLSQVTLGDALEVHGSWSRDAAGRNVLVASRIEKLTTLPDTVLLTAWVAQRMGNVLVLDDVGQTPITASELPDSVQAGALVSFWLTSSAVQTPATLSLPWVAARVALASAQVTQDTSLDLRGDVSGHEAGRIRVQGVWVDLPADWQGAAPSDGTPVQLKLVGRASGWQASSLVVQKKDTSPDIELKGSVRWLGGNTLQLRGTAVQVPPSLLTDSCANLQTGQEVFISLKARRRDPGQLPQATQVTCSVQIPDASVQEAQGVLMGVDSTTKTVEVRVDNATLTLIWTSGQTLMPSITALRSGMSVEIEYQRGSSGLMLRKIKPE